MLIFSAVTPHPPILIPAIGQDSLEQIKKTQQAMQELASDFYAAQPESLIIISPHGELLENAFTINTAPEFKGSFKQFGDMETLLELKGDVSLSYQIKEALETKLPIQMVCQPELDHGVSVPLYYLTQNFLTRLSRLPTASDQLSDKKNLKIIPLGYCSQDYKTHFKLGQQLSEIIHSSEKRIAVVASGDLSHRLTKNAPAGYSALGKKFDRQLIEMIKQRDFEGVINMDQSLVEQAAECGLRSIIILLGVLAGRNCTPQILSYEHPFGVGYLVCNFELNR